MRGPTLSSSSRNHILGREPFDERKVRDGLEMHFAGWSQPLESYIAALEGAGFAVTSLREPTPGRVGSARRRCALGDAASRGFYGFTRT